MNFAFSKHIGIDDNNKEIKCLKIVLTHYDKVKNVAVQMNKFSDELIDEVCSIMNVSVELLLDSVEMSDHYLIYNPYVKKLKKNIKSKKPKEKEELLKEVITSQLNKHQKNIKKNEEIKEKVDE